MRIPVRVTLSLLKFFNRGNSNLWNSNWKRGLRRAVPRESTSFGRISARDIYVRANNDEYLW